MRKLSEKERRFAAAVAAGMKPLAAAQAAGYRPMHHTYRARLNMKNPRVQVAIAAIKAGVLKTGGVGAGGIEAGGVGVGASESAPRSSGRRMSRAGLIRMLSADRELAYREGVPGAAVAASVAIARINGMIAERRPEPPPPGKSLREMSDAELAQHIEALERAAAGGAPQAGADAPREPER